MPKQSGSRRGPRGIPGPAGPSGEPGRVGATGPQGLRGERGARGAPGDTGTEPRTDPMQVLALVEGQIEDIYRELDGQLKRMAQLQLQVDEMRATIRQLVGAHSLPG